MCAGSASVQGVTTVLSLSAKTSAPLTPPCTPLSSLVSDSHWLSVPGSYTLQDPTVTCYRFAALMRDALSCSVQQPQVRGVAPSPCASLLALRDMTLVLGPVQSLTVQPSPLPFPPGGFSPFSSHPGPSPPCPSQAPCGPARAGACSLAAVTEMVAGAAAHLPLRRWLCSRRASSRDALHSHLLEFAKRYLRTDLEQLSRNLAAPAWLRMKPRRRCRRSASP